MDKRSVLSTLELRKSCRARATDFASRTSEARLALTRRRHSASGIRILPGQHMAPGVT